MAVITRQELVRMVAEKIDRKYSQEEIDWIIRGVFQCFGDILKNGDTLKIADVFTMKPILKNERTVENFGKGKITIPAHYAPCFKPYKKLRDVCLDLPVEEETKDEGK